jgi:hypothetical protein
MKRFVLQAFSLVLGIALVVAGCDLFSANDSSGNSSSSGKLEGGGGRNS